MFLFSVLVLKSKNVIFSGLSSLRPLSNFDYARSPVSIGLQGLPSFVPKEIILAAKLMCYATNSIHHF